MHSNVYKLKKRRSPVPFYAVGVWWFVYALMFPMYWWYHYAIAAAMSIFIYILFSQMFPAQHIKIAKTYKAPVSGVGEVDKTIKDAQSTLNSIYDSTGKIALTDSIFAGKIASIIEDGRKILEYLAVNTKKITVLRRFFNYYLPTLDKLLKNYVVLDKHKTAERDYAESKAYTEAAVDMMKTVFDKQLEKLLDDVALDITIDTEVLETMLANSGYKEGGLSNE
ncbi:MAG: 5-bromo-4-chloroindolyl phosphate hydrolysis family protein [Oscillospiraceae bacterium]|nr:5-bromo-4-chloroindolyl phosphate hydrolysis family protein [Oscillospiraceae bacterium]